MVSRYKTRDCENNDKMFMTKSMMKAGVYWEKILITRISIGTAIPMSWLWNLSQFRN